MGSEGGEGKDEELPLHGAGVLEMICKTQFHYKLLHIDRKQTKIFHGSERNEHGALEDGGGAP